MLRARARELISGARATARETAGSRSVYKTSWFTARASLQVLKEPDALFIVARSDEPQRGRQQFRGRISANGALLISRAAEEIGYAAANTHAANFQSPRNTCETRVPALVARREDRWCRGKSCCTRNSWKCYFWGNPLEKNHENGSHDARTLARARLDILWERIDALTLLNRTTGFFFLVFSSKPLSLSLSLPDGIFLSRLPVNTP